MAPPASKKAKTGDLQPMGPIMHKDPVLESSSSVEDDISVHGDDTTGSSDSDEDMEVLPPSPTQTAVADPIPDPSPVPGKRKRGRKPKESHAGTDVEEQGIAWHKFILFDMQF